MTKFKKHRIYLIVVVFLFIAAVEWVLMSQNKVENPTTQTNNNFHQIQNSESFDKHHEELHRLIQLIENHPRSAKLYAEKANLFMLMDQPSQALSDLEAAIELDPENAEFLTNRAQILRRFDRFDHALQDLNKALKIEPGLLAAYFNRGALLFSMEKYQEALTDFSLCIENAPEMSPPYFNRAFAYAELGQLEEAKSDLKNFLNFSENEEWNDLAKAKLAEWMNNPTDPTLPN